MMLNQVLVSVSTVPDAAPRSGPSVGIDMAAIRTVINGITFDGATKDAMQCAVRDALIAFMAATAQAQAEATKEAQRAGIAHAKANGDGRPYKGRKPSFSREQFENAQAMLGKSASVGEVARTTGLTRQTIYRIKDDPTGAEAALATWGM
jgi:putative DNA-invertase from lambdoid prophage Rac